MGASPGLMYQRCKLKQYSGFLMKTKPWDHQLKALEFLYSRDRGALYTVPGSGKTKVMVDLIVNRGWKRVLVVAPKVPCKDVWVDEILMHSNIPKENIVQLTDLEGKKKAALLRTFKKPTEDEGTTIFICNYDSVWMEPVRRVWFHKKLALDCVICDESHKIKSPGGKASGFLAQLGRRVKCCYAMTGTPMAERPEDVYAQYRFIDRSIFGTNYDAFEARYVNIDLKASAGKHYVVKDKKQPYINQEELREKMFSCAFSMPPTVKLPDTNTMTLEIPMPKELGKLYKELEEEGATELGEGFLTIENVLAQSTRLQQVTSGYLSLEDDEGNKWLERISTYRRSALLKLLRGIPESEPVVVFAKFTKDLYSIRKVTERLQQGYSEVSGRENTLTDWKSGRTRILGVQYGAGAEGINLTRSHICVFYSLDHSLAKYEQAVKRIHRPGQKKPCMYYNFVATLPKTVTVDQKILYSLEQKKNYVDLILRGEDFDHLKE